MPAILFVDDEPFLLDTYQRMLRNSIFKCHVLLHSQHLWSYLSRHTIDVVVTDQQMPGASGMALLAELKQKFPTIKRVLISGNLKMIEPGTHDLLHAVLEKPCSKTVLLASLQGLVTPL